MAHVFSQAAFTDVQIIFSNCFLKKRITIKVSMGLIVLFHRSNEKQCIKKDYVKLWKKIALCCDKSPVRCQDRKPVETLQGLEIVFQWVLVINSFGQYFSQTK